MNISHQLIANSNISLLAHMRHTFFFGLTLSVFGSNKVISWNAHLNAVTELFFSYMQWAHMAIVSIWFSYAEPIVTVMMTNLLFKCNFHFKLVG